MYRILINELKIFYVSTDTCSREDPVSENNKFQNVQSHSLISKLIIVSPPPKKMIPNACARNDEFR